MSVETLQCRAGHRFTREAVRGRKPEWCPDHRPLPGKPVERLPDPQSVSVEDESEAKQERPIYSTTTIRGIVAETQEVLEHPRVDDTLKAKLQYTVQEIQSGRRDNRDVAGLNRTRQIYMNDARRQMNRQVVEIV